MGPKLVFPPVGFDGGAKNSLTKNVIRKKPLLCGTDDDVSLFPTVLEAAILPMGNSEIGHFALEEMSRAAKGEGEDF